MKLFKRECPEVRNEPPPDDKWGYALYDDNVILIHPQHPTERSRFDTLIHELLHFLDPDQREGVIKKKAKIVVKLLWDKEGYRRIKK